MARNDVVLLPAGRRTLLFRIGKRHSGMRDGIDRLLAAALHEPRDNAEENCGCCEHINYFHAYSITVADRVDHRSVATPGCCCAMASNRVTTWREVAKSRPNSAGRAAALFRSCELAIVSPHTLEAHQCSTSHESLRRNAVGGSLPQAGGSSLPSKPTTHERPRNGSRAPASAVFVVAPQVFEGAAKQGTSQAKFQRFPC